MYIKWGVFFPVRTLQLLRQLLDTKVLCTLQKPFELQIVEGLTVFSAMALADHPSVSNRVLTERLRVFMHSVFYGYDQYFTISSKVDK